MKKIFLLIVLCFFSATSWAQSADETLEWLNAKKSIFSAAHSNTVGYGDDGKLTLTDSFIRVDGSKGAYSNYGWDRIKDVVSNAGDVNIIFDKDYNGEVSSMRLIGHDAANADKFAKAIKHLATLKGAKLINVDLF